MEVNANIYGSEDMWITINSGNWGSNVPEEEKIKVANFTDLTPEELGNNPDTRKASALGCAAYKMSQDSSWTINGDDGAFNKSVSFVGMSGNKCPYTSIKYFSNINNDQYTSNYPITQLESDTYDVVNFAFHNAVTTLRNDYGNNKRFMDIYKSAQGGGGNGNAVKDPYVRWNPDPFLGNGPSSTYPNYLNSAVSDYASSIRNQDINFITQMPCRRVVLVPFITCSDGNDSSVGTYDLDTYLTTYKTTKPRIISVSFATYIAYRDSDAPTSSNQRQLKYFAMSLLQSSNKFSNHYITIQGSNTREPAENLFYPYLLMSPYIPLGGALNNGHSTNNKPSGLSTQTWSSGAFDNSTWYSVMAVCDLGDMGWTNWSGDNTGETGRGEYLYCNADNLTADEIRESVREGLACFGMFFTDSVANAQTKQLDDAGMFLGTLVNGIGYGDYTEGTANREQPQFNWGAMNESDYDPLNPPTPPQPSLPDNWKDSTNPHYSIANRILPNHWYLCDEFLLKEVFSKLTDIDLNTLDKNLTYGLNPIDCVIQMKRIFFNYSIALEQLTPTQVTDIAIGKKSINITPSPSNSLVVTEYNRPYTFECVTGYPVGEPSIYRDFRSYLPYASCAFYDAFCGIIEIDPAKILNKYITITQTVDFLSGDKITSLYASENQQNRGERIATLNGNCSENLPINGVQAADFIRNNYLLMQAKDISIWSTISKSAMGAGGASISGLMGNTIGAATQAIGTIANAEIASINTETINYQLQHSTPAVSKISVGTSTVEIGVVSGPTLFLYIPRMDENYNQLLYGNLTGFAGYKVVKPKDLTAGTHIFSHPKVSISGTRSEAYMLVDQLQKGIIIK